MPVGIHLRSDTWFGGGLVALQDVDQGRAASNWQWVLPFDEGDFSLPNPDLMADRSATNRFAQMFVGRELGPRWSIAAGESDGRAFGRAKSRRPDAGGHVGRVGANG